MLQIIGYSVKCWITSAVLGVFGFITYTMLFDGNRPKLEFGETVAIGLGYSLLGSIPLLMIFAIINLILYKFITDHIRFRIIISFCAFVTWLLGTIRIFGLHFYQEKNMIGWFFTLYLAGLLFGIWFYKLQLKDDMRGIVDQDDILDVGI